MFWKDSGKGENKAVYNSLIVNKQRDIAEVTFNSGNGRNSITMEFLNEMEMILDEIEEDDSCKMIVFYGQNGYFCTGMDFHSYVSAGAEEKSFSKDSQEKFMALLRRISLYPKIVVSIVEGEAMAGGVGIAAASDLLFASVNSRFSLSETLWGLLPAMVMPYLVRRIGYQNAFRMALTTLPADAARAKEMGLIDECFSERREVIVKYFPRLLRLQSSTVAELKNYMRQLWIIDSDMEARAVRKTTELAGSESVRNNIARFVNDGKFAWER